VRLTETGHPLRNFTDDDVLRAAAFDQQDAIEALGKAGTASRGRRLQLRRNTPQADPPPATSDDGC
jgi:hypothetical protein